MCTWTLFLPVTSVISDGIETLLLSGFLWCMMRFSDLRQYDYELPPELIRRQGVEPRDSARLFVYDTGTDTVSFDTFRNIASYLPKRSF